jgi:hypothetical protein
MVYLPCFIPTTGITLTLLPTHPPSSWDPAAEQFAELRHSPHRARRRNAERHGGAVQYGAVERMRRVGNGRHLVGHASIRANACADRQHRVRTGSARLAVPPAADKQQP